MPLRLFKKLKCYGELFLDPFLQDEVKLQFSSFLFPKGGDLICRDTGGDFLAQEIKAEHVAGEKLTTFFREKETARRIISCVGNSGAQEQVQEKKGRAEMFFDTRTAAGSPFLDFTGSTQIRDPDLSHGFARPADRPLQHHEAFGELLVTEEILFASIQDIPCP
jgi:hypothetical protein